MLGIYAHIPFCASKCAYCNFVSVAGTKLLERYLAALKAEAALTGALRRDTADTVFFGGGTPGLLSAEDFTGLMACLRQNFNILPSAEITVETNPDAVTPEKLDAYLSAGVNRLSIGLQAAQGRLLGLLARPHTVDGFDSAYKAARSAGFKNINIDAIYGIPTQTDEEWMQTLYHILYLKPEHISAYALKLEEGTRLFDAVAAKGLPSPDDDAAAGQYIAARALLTQKGFTNYEISNFSKIGSECAHNMKYWTLGDYVGLGVSAHSNIGNMRYANYSDIQKYITQLETGALSYESGEFISQKERAKEALMLQTRLKRGVDLTAFKETHGIDLKKNYAANLEKAEKYGLITADKNRIYPTEKGFLFQNRLALMLTENI